MKVIQVSAPSISELTGAGLHVGRTRRDWTSNSEKYTTGYRHGVSVFDLAQTSFFFRRAISFIEQSTLNYGRGFFYGFAGKGDRKIIALLTNLGQVVSRTRWNGGFVTNTKQFKRRVKNYSLVPSFVVCFKLETRNYSVLREKYRLKLPLICPIDANSDPSYAEYPIPASSVGRSAVGFFGHHFTKAAFSGIVKRIKRALRKFKTFKAQALTSSFGNVDPKAKNISLASVRKSFKDRNKRPQRDILETFEPYYYTKKTELPNYSPMWSSGKSQLNNSFNSKKAIR